MSVTLGPPPAAPGPASAGPPAPGPRPVPAPTLAAWDTPRRMRAALAAVALAARLLFLAVSAGARQHFEAAKTVGRDAAPSVVAAERIKAALADMDANVANELIARPGQNARSVQGYEQRRRELSDALLAAAGNITYGDAERVPIQTITYNLGTYEALVAQARLLHGRGGDRAVLTTYRQAEQLMRGTILPAADALDKANDDALESGYGRQKARSGATQAAVWAAGLLLLAALAAAQVWLGRRTHRVFSLPLMGATALAALFLVLAAGRLSSASEDLRAAKQDSFDSVYALWHARAVAYNANADESRWLIDRAHASDYQNDFLTQSAQIAALPPGETYAQVAALCQQGGVKGVPQGFQGFLANELRNITFAGEQDAASGALTAWGRYISIDGQIRALERGGKHGEAVALCTGDRPDQSNGAFEAFDDALGRTLDINEAELAKDTAQGFGDLGPLPVLAPVALLGVVLLAWLGIHARLREYGG